MNPFRSNVHIGSDLANNRHAMIFWPGSPRSSVRQIGGPYLPPNGHSSFMVIACLPNCLIFWLHRKAQDENRQAAGLPCDPATVEQGSCRPAIPVASHTVASAEPVRSPPEAPTAPPTRPAAQAPPEKLLVSPPPISEPFLSPQVGDQHVSNVQAPFYDQHNRPNPRSGFQYGYQSKNSHNYWSPLASPGGKEWIDGASHGILALVLVGAWILQREKATARACLMARILR